MKSNLAYELYQSQCLQPDGLIQRTTFSTHPYGSANRERRLYKEMGEMAFLDQKRQQFWDAVRADPLDFIDRAACRFLGVTLWYVPLDRAEEPRRPWAFRLSRVGHPLPFLALLVMAGTAAWLPLGRAQWSALAAYGLYLLPYVAASYYDRYGLPLLGVRVLLAFWAADRLLALLPLGRARGAAPVLTQPPARAARRPAPVASHP